MKKAFTLVEMMIAISILAIIFIFLYKSYTSINLSNKKFENITNHIKNNIKIKKVIYLDFSLILNKNVTILNQDTKKDVIFFQTSNSVHNRINPYVAYLIKDKKLYRLESLTKLTYPISTELNADVDILGKVNSFRVYKSSKKDSNTTNNLFLVDIKFKNKDNILYKIKALNLSY